MVLEDLPKVPTDEMKLTVIGSAIKAGIHDALFCEPAEITPLHQQNNIQTIATFVRSLDRGTVFVAGMLFSLGIVTFFAARR